MHAWRPHTAFHCLQFDSHASTQSWNACRCIAKVLHLRSPVSRPPGRILGLCKPTALLPALLSCACWQALLACLALKALPHTGGRQRQPLPQLTPAPAPAWSGHAHTQHTPPVAAGQQAWPPGLGARCEMAERGGDSQLARDHSLLLVSGGWASGRRGQRGPPDHPLLPASPAVA